MDKKDLEAGNKIACPVLVIVGGQSHTARFYGYERAWSTYVTNPAEQAPDESYSNLREFFTR
jgi:uncharacterized membrane protein